MIDDESGEIVTLRLSAKNEAIARLAGDRHLG
jgi:hypothetical protein